jgi:predicted alpha/beta hydrolase
VHEIRLNARDGYALAATLFEPASPNGRAAMLCAAAGVPRGYYARYAAYLAERGFVALTFDYRGIGGSRPSRLRGFRAQMRDWVHLDIGGALDFFAARFAQHRLSAIGQSFGGQALGAVEGNERIASALLIASQSGYWRHWRGVGKAGMFFVTHALLPVGSRALGFFPASVFGMGEDLPAGVATEWARWCRTRDYLVGDLGDAVRRRYAAFAAPILAYSFTDDGYAPLPALQALMALYAGAKKEIRRVAPADIAASRIGHFGFFREQFREPLWRPSVDWLAAS